MTDRLAEFVETLTFETEKQGDLDSLVDWSSIAMPIEDFRWLIEEVKTLRESRERFGDALIVLAEKLRSTALALNRIGDL